MEFYFSTVNDVLPLGAQRAYVPRASRPHLAWSTQERSRALGTQIRLRGDGTAAREAASGDPEHGATDIRDASCSMKEVGLAGLLTTDAASGTRLAFYGKANAVLTPVCSAFVPSQRRIAALWTPLTGDGDSSGSAPDWGAQMPPTFVSDGVGNVYLYRWASSSPDEGIRATKRLRGENDAGHTIVGTHHDGRDNDGEWVQLAAAHSTLSSTVVSMGDCSSSGLASLFSVTRGAPGWAGLTALSTSGVTTAATQLVSVREFYHDVRLLDATSQTLVRTYSTTHAPTGVFCPSVEAAPHCALVAEGCLATLYDVRCPSAVLTLGEVYEAQAEWRSARDTAALAADKEKAAISAGANHPQSKEPSARTPISTVSATTTPSLPPLIPGRLTSTVGQVRDICGTANAFEVACAVDRALCVYDLRKFNRLFTSSSVLKYVIGSLASVAGGCGVVCAGIDAEVRLIPFHCKESATIEESPSFATRAVAQIQQKKKQRSDSPKANDQNGKSNGGANADMLGPGGTFRTRLNTSVSCTTVWQGGWVTTCNGFGAAAVGISVDGELYIAQ